MTVMDAVEARKRGDLATLLDLLSDTDIRTRWAAAQQLGKLGDPGAIEPLVRRLQAADDGLRVSAIRALAAIGDASAAPALIETAGNDPASGVRLTAIEALALLGDPRGGEMLAMLAVDPESLLATSERKFASFQQRDYRRERRWATKRLRELQPKGALPALERTRPRSQLQRIRLARIRRALRARSGRVG